jgi:adenosylmethionine-8-amino-7-oxononanoate aminotransferase
MVNLLHAVTSPAFASARNPCEGHHYFPRSPTRSYLSLVRGDGVYVYDEHGRAILDGASGAAVACLGHGNARIADRMAAQARTLAFAHGSQFVSPQVLELADRLAAKSGCPDSRVYFASGGSEATETALKIALAYHSASGAPRRQRVVSRSVSYHGATFGALAMTGHQQRRRLYESLIAPFPKIPAGYCYRCPYGLDPASCAVECADELDRVVTEHGADSIAAFIVEPVIGASAPGVAAPRDYMGRIAETCRRHDILLIADEVMSGVGRTGRFLAMEHYGVAADITVLSKGLSAGYSPLAAVIVSGRVYGRISAGGPSHLVHGFTYSGNPLSAAVGLEVLSILDEDRLVERAAEMGRRLIDRLARLEAVPMVGEIRGQGLLIGMEFVADRPGRRPFPPDQGVAWKVQAAALDEGLWVYAGTGSHNGNAGDHILIAPPYIISDGHIDELVTKLSKALAAVQPLI